MDPAEDPFAALVIEDDDEAPSDRQARPSKVAAPASYRPKVVEPLVGSCAVDGVGLAIAAMADRPFAVWRGAPAAADAVGGDGAGGRHPRRLRHL